MFDNNSDGQLPRRDRLGPRQGQKQGRRPSGQVSFFQIYFGWFSEKECGMPFAIFSLLFRLQKSLSEERIWYLVTYSPLLQILPFLFIVRLLRSYYSEVLTYPLAEVWRRRKCLEKRQWKTSSTETRLRYPANCDHFQTLSEHFSANTYIELSVATRDKSKNSANDNFLWYMLVWNTHL